MRVVGILTVCTFCTFLFGCGTTQTTAAGDAGGDADASAVDASTVLWRLTPGVGTAALVEAQVDGIVVSGSGTTWSGDAGQGFTVELDQTGGVVWDRVALTRGVAPDPSGWSIVGSADSETGFPGWPTLTAQSEFLAFVNYGPSKTGFLLLKPFSTGGVELDGVVRAGNSVWVRGMGGASVDLGGGALDGGTTDSGQPRNFVAKYFGATAFMSAQFFSFSVTALAAASFGVWGGAADPTAVRLFRITTAGVYTEVRAFPAAGAKTSFDSFVTTADDGLVATLRNWSGISVDFGLPASGAGGTLVVKFDSSGTPVWSKSLGDPPSPADMGVKRRLRTGGVAGGNFVALGSDQGRSALFLLSADGALVTTWRAEPGDRIYDFDVVGGTIVVGTAPNGAGWDLALVEKITSFP